MERFYGAKKDKFNPKAQYHKPKLIKLTGKNDMSAYSPGVINQYSVGRCTGCGTGGAAHNTAKQLNVKLETFGYSPDFIYNGARYLEGTLNEDAGAYADDVMTWIKTKSSLLYPKWPLTEEFSNTDPNEYTDKTEKYTIDTFRVDNGVEGIESAMMENHPIIICIPFITEWENYTADVLSIPKESDTLAGWHCMFADYIDCDEAMVYGQNSWDTSWGLKGRFKMPLESFESFKKWFGGYDVHYITIKVQETTNTDKCKILSLHKLMKERRLGK